MTTTLVVSLVDIALALVVLEAAVVAWRHREPARRADGMRLLATLAAGAILMLAVRFALTGTDPALVLVLLAAAGIAHLGDLWLRWRR